MRFVSVQQVHITNANTNLYSNIYISRSNYDNGNIGVGVCVCMKCYTVYILY